MFGIEGLQIYFPKTYIDQAEYEQFKGVGTGKYTKGLGQLQLSFTHECEDINSISLTVVNNLMQNYNIHPSQVGRLEIGTETLFDKSKSTKTVLMELFKGNHDIQGATSINACYGATNALINTLNWVTSPFWDGRYGIVVAADIAVYEDGPARCTGGAGAVAILIGPNGKIVFNKERSTYIDNVYDFYKPNPASEYPTVDGKVSIDCYLKAVEECYKKLKQKSKNKNILQEMNYYCFHSPFYKMVQKAYFKLVRLEEPNLSDKECLGKFMEKCHPTLHLSQRLGNIYTGSLFSCLISLLITNPLIKNKNVCLFSYGSGCCASMLTARVIENPLPKTNNILEKLGNRIKISPKEYTQIMLVKQKNYGKLKGKLNIQKSLLDDNVYFLAEVDEKWRRRYDINNPIFLKRKVSSMGRLQNLNKHIGNKQQISKFYKLPVQERFDIVNEHTEKELDKQTFENGGLTIDLADTMIENVIGVLSLPLSIIPTFVINKKKYMIPMCIEEPSVVAACSSIGKLLSPYSFFTSSTPNIMIGQLHLPNAEIHEIHQIVSEKKNLIEYLNKDCENMVKRGGGVTDIRVRQLNEPFSKQYSIDIFVNVCEAMGANITNMLCQSAKKYISMAGINTGIAILSNYCTERKALSWFEIPIKDLGWKGVNGYDVALKILEAYEFAKSDRFRAVTHNKGIMNGIDSVCVATGQDWRAVQSSAHAYASRTKQYQPLSHYSIEVRDEVTYFKGSLQLPISVGSKGGVMEKNPLYKSTMDILKNPSAQELAEILVSVGLAQNFGALRALAIEGIQKGHMVLHVRAIAQKAGVPKEMIDRVCEEMIKRKRYDVNTAKEIHLELKPVKPKL